MTKKDHNYHLVLVVQLLKMQDIYLITGSSSDIGLELISNILVSNPNSKIICCSTKINSKLRSLKKENKDRIEIVQLNFLINKEKKIFFDKIKKIKLATLFL